MNSNPERVTELSPGVVPLFCFAGLPWVLAPTVPNPLSSVHGGEGWGEEVKGFCHEPRLPKSSLHPFNPMEPGLGLLFT